MMYTLRALFSRKAILPRLRQGESIRARLRCGERLETRAMLAADALSPWQNHVLPNDVNGDGYVTAIDALNVINELNIAGARQLSATGPAPTINRARFMAAGGDSARYLDVNGDGHLTSMDALAVVNKLNAAQGEQVHIRLQVTDLAGNPIESIGAGQEFQLRGLVKDLREPQNDPVRGAYSFYADVLFDQTKSTVDLVGRTIAYGSLFPNGENSDSSITATPGKLEDIGAFAENDPYGSQEVVLFIVPMQAAAGASGVASFMVQDDMSDLFDVAMHGSNESVPPGEILFIGDQVTIGFPPTAGNDTASVVEDSGLNSINVLANDDPHEQGQEPLLVAEVTQGAHGLVEVAPDGLTVRYTPADDYFGPDTFTYTVEDADGNSATASVSVNVTAVNDPPTANNDNPVVDSGSTANEILVLGNDTIQPDAGETLTITDVGPTSNSGIATIAAGGQRILYSPAAGFIGTETFTYMISDGTLTATATVTVTVNDDNPIANDDNNLSGVGEDTVSNPLNVLANDELAPGVEGELTIIAVGPRSDGGTVTISQDMKMLSYTPAPNFFGTETFTYTISDGQGGQATATVRVTVDNINDPPTANDDTFTRLEDSTNNNLPVLDNDSILPDAGETLTITDVSPGSAGGTIDILPGNTVIRYTPRPNFVGTETFTYTISDGGEEDTATVTVMVTEVTEPPEAGDDEYIVGEDSTSNSLTVLSNDTDPDPGDTLTISEVSPGTRNGTITISTDMRSINYTPAPNVFGTEVFTYTVSDGHGGSDTATVEITIIAANDPPNAVDDPLSVQEDSTDNTLDVLENDENPDAGETLTITEVGETSGNGTVSVATDGLSLIYTPAAGFVGEETFTYTIDDGTGMTDMATVTVTVMNVNNPPTANDDEFSVAEDSAAAPLNVLANDTFAPDTGETLTITAVTAGSMGGAVTISNDSLSVMYEPDEDFFGTETFTYTISDGNGGSDTATVTVTVNPVNDPPVAVDDTATTAEDTALTIDPATLLANDTDVENNTLTITAVSGAVGGTVALNGGMITFTPTTNFNGPASFQYTVSDGNNGTDTGTVNLTVTAVNDPPTAVNDTFEVMRGSSSNTLNPLANDDDAPDTGETLTITAVDDISDGGTVTITEGGTRLSYTPAAGFSGTETFTYTVSDGALTSTATITVTVANFVPGSLSGFVYVDADSDGVKDGAEQPIANVTIRLWGKDILGQDVDTRTTTDASGAYRFDNVMPGSYVIEEVQPTNFLDGVETLGTQGGTAGHDMFFIALANGASGANNNFGERGLRPAFIGRPNFFVP